MPPLFQTVNQRCTSPDQDGDNDGEETAVPTGFKTRVELEALRKDKTVQEIATRRQMHSSHVIQWNHNARWTGVHVRGVPGLLSPHRAAGALRPASAAGSRSPRRTATSHTRPGRPRRPAPAPMPSPARPHCSRSVRTPARKRSHAATFSCRGLRLLTAVDRCSHGCRGGCWGPLQMAKRC